jgi:hypothetical protein
VWRNSQGLLSKLSSDANDQTHEILRTVIRTVFTAISGALFDPTKTAVERAGVIDENPADAGDIDIFSARFDPTNPDKVAFVNEHLREFGFCIAALPENARRTISPDEYCENPQAYKNFVGGSPLAKPAGARILTPALEGGVIYRPRLPYALVLFEKQYLSQKTRRGPEPLWHTTRKKTIWIENESPAIAVNVDRTLFAQRTLTMTFDDGVLNDVKIRKGSELANAIEIPLQIIESIAALPANIIQVRIDQTLGQKALLEKETQLLNAQSKLLQRRLATDPSKNLGAGKITELTTFAKSSVSGNATFPQIPTNP